MSALQSLSVDQLNLIIISGALVLAIFTTLLYFRASQGGRADRQGWKRRYRELDERMSRLEAAFGTYSGIVLVWSGWPRQGETEWGRPRIYGSPVVLASVARFVAQDVPTKKGQDLAERILDGLADQPAQKDGQESESLREHLGDLRKNGDMFSIAITLPEGQYLNAQGRAVGRQIVLWLEDMSLRGSDDDIETQLAHIHKIPELDPPAFLDMMSRSPFPMWRADMTGRLIWVNMAYIEAVSAESLEAVLEAQVQLDADMAVRAKEVLVSGERLQEMRPTVISGQLRPTSLTLFPVSGGVMGLAIDASETESLRDMLNRHMRAHDETLNRIDDAVVIFGSDGKMTFHNDVFAGLFGLENAWFKNHPDHGEWLDNLREKRLLPEQADYKAWKAAELSLYTDWPDEMPDEAWTLPDGRTLRVTRMRDPEGGIFILFVDITDRLDLESQFKTQLKVQKATLDKLSEAIAVFGTDGRLKIHNTAFEALWNMPEDSLVDNPHFNSLIPSHLPLYHDRVFWDQLKALSTDPNPEVRRPVEGEITRSDDKVLSWLSKPLPDGATLIVWDDITDERRTEAALIERAEAVEAADRLKSEFVGHVSYQLRTPLTTITGYADLLQSETAGELNDKQSEHLFAIQSASEDLAKTIDDILDIAAIEANVLDLELGDVDVYEMLYNALDYVATKAEDTKISLQLDCAQDIGVIRADETRLKQVVYNLLSNALRFTKPGGHIDLGARQADDGGVMIWVHDDGVGIPSERQPKVFESFQSSRGGAGLGLALVQRFIERHGGWVALESEEDEGTHVTCYLPREAHVESAHPELFSLAEDVYAEIVDP